MKIASAVAVAVALVGCGNSKPERAPYYIVDLENDDLRLDELAVAIAGQRFEFDGRHAVLEPAAGTVAPGTPITVTYTTPCGNKTLQLQPISLLEGRSQLVIRNSDLPGRVEVVIDPEIQRLELGAVVPPQPPPERFMVTFADCPRTIRVEGREVVVPAAAEPDTVFIARDAAACYVRGQVVYGTFDPSNCKPESSERFEGQAAYVFAMKDFYPTYKFKEPSGSEKGSRSRGCWNSGYLRKC